MKQIGIHVDEMDAFSIGDILDMYIEQGNDNEEWEYLPTQEDIDRLMR